MHKDMTTLHAEAIHKCDKREETLSGREVHQASRSVDFVESPSLAVSIMSNVLIYL